MATTLTNQGGRNLKVEESKPTTPLLYDPATGLQYLPESVLGKLTITNYIWDTGTLAWIKQTAAASGGGGPVTIADGDDVTQGAIADAAVVTDTTGTLSGKLRGLVKWAFERMPAALGQATMANSLPVVIASNQSAIAVSGTLTAVTTVGTITNVVHVDDNAGSLTVDGSVSLAAAIPAGTNNIGDIDVLTVPADPFGVNADAASATGSISAKLRFIAGTGIPITGTVTVAAHAVTNAGTFAVQVDGAALTSLQLLDDAIFQDDTAFDDETSKGIVTMMMADETSTDSITEGDVGVPRITLDRKQVIADYAHSVGGADSYSILSSAAVISAEIKASAGNIFSVSGFNNAAGIAYVRIYNQTGAPGTGDAANIIWRGMIPGNTAGAGFSVTFAKGRACGTGIGVRVTGAVADNDGTALAANQVMLNVGYK